MSSSIEKLPANIQQLVKSSALPTPENDAAEVNKWIDQVAANASKWTNAQSLKELDTSLRSKTYLVGTSPTQADIALWGALHPAFSKLSPQEYYTLPSLTRFIDHIQNLPSSTSSSSISALLPHITFHLENAPKAERVPEPPKVKKEKAPPAASTPADSAAAEKKQSKKDKTAAPAEAKAASSADGAAAPKKEKKAKAPAPAPAPAADAGPPAPSMIDLRVGKIIEIARHPDADGLYVEQVDIGEETGPRTIVSGLVNYIPIEQMRDRFLVVVCNLKPANMRGIKSYGMVLCATSKDGKDAGIEIVDPPAGSVPGDRVFFEGEAYQNATPVSQMNPKKKIFETIQPGLTTLEDRSAVWVDPNTKSVHKIVTSKGVCKPRTLVGASLS